MIADGTPLVTGSAQDGERLQSATYIANMSAELHGLALAEGYEILAYLLGMVHHEAVALRGKRRDAADRRAARESC